ncbi:MAG: hypothetical protein ABIA76_05525 [Candidatus Diapherotrites archaeon]
MNQKIIILFFLLLISFSVFAFEPCVKTENGQTYTVGRAGMRDAYDHTEFCFEDVIYAFPFDWVEEDELEPLAFCEERCEAENLEEQLTVLDQYYANAMNSDKSGDCDIGEINTKYYSLGNGCADALFVFYTEPGKCMKFLGDKCHIKEGSNMDFDYYGSNYVTDDYGRDIAYHTWDEQIIDITTQATQARMDCDNDRECEEEIERNFWNYYWGITPGFLQQAYPRKRAFIEESKTHCVTACMSKLIKSDMAIVSSKTQVIADGEDFIEFEVQVSREGEPVNGEAITVFVGANDTELNEFIGETQPTEGVLSNGVFSSRFKPNDLRQVSSEKITGEPITASIYAWNEATNESTSTEIQILPPAETKIIFMEPIQAFKGNPLVAGKQMVVMIGIKAIDPAFYQNPNADIFLDFEIIGDEFDPRKEFKRIDVKKYVGESGSGLTTLEAEKATGDDTDNYLYFFEYFKVHEGGAIDYDPNENKKWVFYSFYVDGKNTKLNGAYTLKTRLYLEKKNPAAGEETIIEVDSKEKSYPVFASPQFTIALMPVGLGYWNDDFCEYCVSEKGISELEQDSIPYSKRFNKNEITQYKFTCKKEDFFKNSFNGLVDLQKINAVLTKDNSKKRKFCKQEFEKLFTQKELQQLAGQPPIAVSGGGTWKEQYESMAIDSVKYFTAVMPVAEEELGFMIYRSPYQNVNPKTVWPTSLLIQMYGNGLSYGTVWYDFSKTRRTLMHSANELVQGIVDNFSDAYVKLFSPEKVHPKTHHVKRLALFSPSNPKTSNFYLPQEGVMNALVNPGAVIVNVPVAGEAVMTHEILHTYCAIDEYYTQEFFDKAIGARPINKTLGNIITGRQDVSVFFVCPEGEDRINSRSSDGKESQITSGFWVQRKEFRGTSKDPNYSIMGDHLDDERWITQELYYGVGNKIGTFPDEFDSTTMIGDMPGFINFPDDGA